MSEVDSRIYTILARKAAIVEALKKDGFDVQESSFICIQACLDIMVANGMSIENAQTLIDGMVNMKYGIGPRG